MQTASEIEPFSQTLSRQGICLRRQKTGTLQVNVGLLCNQTCRHCHLDAGPERKEIMNAATAEAVIACAQRCSCATIDITGGAPELNPNISRLVEGLAPCVGKLIFRSNLTALADGKRDELLQLLRASRAAVVASFPSLDASQTDAQRGPQVFERSLAVLRKLNEIGYGQPDTGLELNLVSNPAGAFLPPAQACAGKRFREALRKKTGIVFNEFFSLANAPLGRFRSWLISSGNYDDYMKRLVSAFNPAAAAGMMCRTLVSVSWDGYLYDCDFNQAEQLFLGGRKIHISEMLGPPDAELPIMTGNHCYACAAGAGFTCTGAIAA